MQRFISNGGIFSSQTMNRTQSNTNVKISIFIVKSVSEYALTTVNFLFIRRHDLIRGPRYRGLYTLKCEYSRPRGEVMERPVTLAGQGRTRGVAPYTASAPRGRRGAGAAGDMAGPGNGPGVITCR